MFLLGTIVDALAIVVGTAIGILLPRIPERMKDTVTKGIALCVIVIGLSMALNDTGDILIIIISVVLGGVVGEIINIDGALSRFANAMEKRFARVYKGPIAEGFISATLLFCIGSMAIVGAIQEGIQNQHRTLLAKSVLDGFSAIVFSSTLGVGVGLSAIPVFLYQGLIAFISHLAGNVLNAPELIAILTSTGGLLIVAIGLNVMGLTKTLVANLLPALLLAPLVKAVLPFLQRLFHAL